MKQRVKHCILLFMLMVAATACTIDSKDNDDSPPPSGPVTVDDQGDEGSLPAGTEWVEVEHPLGGTIWCLSGGYSDGTVLWCDPATRSK